MHDLQSVAIVQGSFRPAVSRHNVAVEFDCDPVRAHAKLFDERTERLRRDDAALSVNSDIHGIKRLQTAI